MKRLVAVAAQKFVSDICTDALNLARIKAQKKKRDKSSSAATDKSDKDLTLTVEELSKAAQQHGISVKKPRFFADSASAAQEAKAAIASTDK